MPLPYCHLDFVHYCKALLPDENFECTVNPLPDNILMHLRHIAVENIVRKGETARNKQFLLFSQCLLPYMTLIFHFNAV